MDGEEVVGCEGFAGVRLGAVFVNVLLDETLLIHHTWIAVSMRQSRYGCAGELTRLLGNHRFLGSLARNWGMKVSIDPTVEDQQGRTHFRKAWRLCSGAPRVVIDWSRMVRAGWRFARLDASRRLQLAPLT